MSTVGATGAAIATLMVFGAAHAASSAQPAAVPRSPRLATTIREVGSRPPRSSAARFGSNARRDRAQPRSDRAGAHWEVQLILPDGRQAVYRGERESVRDRRVIRLRVREAAAALASQAVAAGTSTGVDAPPLAAGGFSPSAARVPRRSAWGAVIEYPPQR